MDCSPWSLVIAGDEQMRPRMRMKNFSGLRSSVEKEYQCLKDRSDPGVFSIILGSKSKNCFRSLSSK